MTQPLIQHHFDVSALAQRSQGIDTTSASTCDAFVASMRASVERGLLCGSA